MPLTWDLEADAEMEPLPGHGGGVNDGGVLCQLPLSAHSHLLVVGLASPQEVLPCLGADVLLTAAKEDLLWHSAWSLSPAASSAPSPQTRCATGQQPNALLQRGTGSPEIPFRKKKNENSLFLNYDFFIFHHLAFPPSLNLRLCN